MKASKRESITLERKTFVWATRQLKRQSWQLSRELRYIPTLFFYIIILSILYLLASPDVQAPYECTEELNQKNRMVEDLIMEKKAICPPLILPKGGVG